MSRPGKIHPLVGARFVVKVAQMVRALDCGSRGRGFESPLSPFFRTRVKRLFARTRYNGCEERQLDDLLFFIYYLPFFVGNIKDVIKIKTGDQAR